MTATETVNVAALVRADLLNLDDVFDNAKLTVEGGLKFKYDDDPTDGSASATWVERGEAYGIVAWRLVRGYISCDANGRNIETDGDYLGEWQLDPTRKSLKRDQLRPLADLEREARAAWIAANPYQDEE